MADAAVRPDSSDDGLIRQLTNRVITHQLFRMLHSLDAVRVFMEHHVWCVWDFMCLAKSIQEGLSPKDPWHPSAYPEELFRINEILATEETDVGPQGTRTSHFQIFVRAMQRAGASTAAVEAFTAAIASGGSPLAALIDANAPVGAAEFVSVTLRHAAGPLHVRAASFSAGREELVPYMLLEMKKVVPWEHPELAGLRWYVDRHIELDVAQHGPSSHSILDAMIGGDEQRAAEARAAGIEALKARLNYLDEIAKRV